MIRMMVKMMIRIRMIDDDDDDDVLQLLFC
jgi:hypothetical protein